MSVLFFLYTPTCVDQLFQFVFCPLYTVVLFDSLCWKLRIRCAEIILDDPRFMVLRF